MKIAYTNDIFSDLIIDKNSLELKNLLKLQQNQIEDNILNEKIDLALVNPMTYIQIKKKKDVRVIPFSPLFLDDYTNIASLNITRNSKEQKKLSNSIDNDYIFNISRILMSERYQIQVMNTPISGGSEIVYNSDNSMLDISEDWKDSFKISLPIYFWVAVIKEEIQPLETYLNIIKSIAIQQNSYISNEDKSREGLIVREWSEECESSLDNLYEVLFYHNIADEIHASKIYNEVDIIEERSENT